MHALLELQRQFRDALLVAGHATDTPSMQPAWVLADGIEAAQRLQIYRNNVVTAFTTTLAATFPVIERLGGADWFRQCARDYQCRHPSAAGDLQYVGQRFPAFLRQRFGATEFAYFEAVARLEWAYQEVLIAAAGESFDPASLAAVEERDQDDLVFRLRPATRLVESTVPILAIWNSNQPGAPAEHIALDRGPASVLLVRRRGGVHLREIPLPAAFLFKEFANGARFAAAAAAFATAHGEADFGHAFRDLIGLDVIASFTSNPARSPA